MSNTAFSPEALAQVQRLDDDGVVAHNQQVAQLPLQQAPAFNTTILGIGVQTAQQGAGVSTS